MEASLLASGLAALVSRSIMHPMDTIRLRLQVGPSATTEAKPLSLKELNPKLSPQPLSLTTVSPKPLAILSSPATTELISRVGSLYSGYSVAIAFTIPGLTLFLTSYDLTKATLSKYTRLDKNHLANHCLSGFVAQGLAGLVFNPMEVVKGYLQTQKSGMPNSPTVSGLIKTVYTKQGLGGFFKGYWLSVAVFGPHNVIYFSAYEKFKHFFSKKLTEDAKSKDPESSHVPILEAKHFLMSSSMAVFIAATLTHPIDVVRARYQIISTQHSFSSSTSLAKPLTVSQLIKYMWHSEGGIRPFYRGLMYRALYFVPNTALSMTLFESFKPIFMNLLDIHPSI